MTASVKVKVTRPVMHDGESHAVGTILRVDELGAIALLESNRVELCDARDAAMLKVVAAGEVRKALRAAGPLPQAPGSPWAWTGKY